MTINLIFKIAAVGVLVSILCQVLKHSGRDEQAFIVSLAGLILVLSWILPFIYDLFLSIRQLFSRNSLTTAFSIQAVTAAETAAARTLVPTTVASTRRESTPASAMYPCPTHQFQKTISTFPVWPKVYARNTLISLTARKTAAKKKRIFPPGL